MSLAAPNAQSSLRLCIALMLMVTTICLLASSASARPSWSDRPGICARMDCEKLVIKTDTCEEGAADEIGPEVYFERAGMDRTVLLNYNVTTTCPRVYQARATLRTMLVFTLSNVHVEKLSSCNFDEKKKCSWHWADPEEEWSIKLTGCTDVRREHCY